LPLPPKKTPASAFWASSLATTQLLLPRDLAGLSRPPLQLKLCARRSLELCATGLQLSVRSAINGHSSR
jgi:hypothetical protein